MPQEKTRTAVKEVQCELPMELLSVKIEGIVLNYLFIKIVKFCLIRVVNL